MPRILPVLRMGMLTAALLGPGILDPGSAAWARTIQLDSGGTWDRIKSSGVSEEASWSLMKGKAKTENETTIYGPENAQVTWWAEFRKFTFVSSDQGVFQSKWYSPDGKLFKDEVFRLSFGQALFVKTTLPLQSTGALKYPGAWKVEIYHQNQLMDTKNFEIRVDSEAEKGPSSSASQESAEKPEILEEAVTMQDDARTGNNSEALPKTSPPQTDDPYEQAKILFQKGEHKKAEGMLQELLAKQPFRTDAHMALASIYVRQELWDKAVQELDYAVQNPEYYAKAMEMREKILSRKKKLTAVGGPV